MSSSADRIAELEHELALTRRELKWLRIEQEHMAEALQRVRRQRAKLRTEVESLQAEQGSTASRGLLRRRRGAAADGPAAR